MDADLALEAHGARVCHRDTPKSGAYPCNKHKGAPVGFVHANYYMLGKQHATSMDAEVVKSIADWIKLSRQ